MVNPLRTSVLFRRRCSEPDFMPATEFRSDCQGVNFAAQRVRRRATSVEKVYEMAASLSILFKRNCPYCQSSLTSVILSRAGLGRFPAGGEDFQAHVAAGFGPFVVLLGQHRANQADDGVAAGEDADHVGAPADVLVQPFLRVVAPDLPPDLAGKVLKARMSSRAASKCAAAAGSLASGAATIWACRARTEAASGCSKMVRTRVDTHGWAVLARG
jgi:hypothetical protein